MDFSEILELKKQLDERKIPRSVMENYELAFDIEYAHHSTAIEGNTLTLIETKAILEDGIAVGGKRLREIYEVVNHNNAFNYAKKKIAEHVPLDENLVNDFHEKLMENIFQGGIYRNHDVMITGASHKPPSPNEMYRQIKAFYAELNDKAGTNPIELAAWTHAEFVRIHPFSDGNGRTARLIMNYQLMYAGLLPVNIRTENRISYYDALDKYAAEGDLRLFAELISELEAEQIRKYLAIVF
ncbi:MAG: Fic family protein [Oscillospiraceae bacterium]